MSERAPYSRVYWTVRNDPRLVGIYSDDHHWATWNRLLLAADMAWPAPADMPGSVRKASLVVLETAGVIEILPGGLFRFHGLDTERGRRRDAAAASAAYRTGTGRPPDGNRTPPSRLPSRAEPSRAELKPSRAVAREESAEDLDPADVYWSLTGSYPNDKARDWIDDLTETFGAAGVIAAMAAECAADPSGKTLIGRVKTSLQREARRLDRQEQEVAKAKIVEMRRPTVLRHQPEEISPEEADRIAREYMAEGKARREAMQ